MTDEPDRPMAVTAVLEVVDWRRRVAQLYAEARAGGATREAWQRWCDARQALFATHPQSAGPHARLRWFAHDPAWRLVGRLESAPQSSWRTEEGAFTRVGTVAFESPGSPSTSRLAVWWLEAYAGGLFIPFRDATAGRATYGGGRYLVDSAKSADLGSDGDRIVLDFNYAYHPSCTYDPRWPCPLAPAENRLDVEVTAGEMLPGMA